MSMQDVDWDSLDKRRFFVVGLGLFSSVTTCLYPLTVIKTRQMASSHTSPGIAGAWQTARTIATTDGIPGFYRGFATAVFATIPVRMVYMSALEMTKTATAKVGAKLDLAPTTQATLANFCGGAAASLASQCLVVPVDVVTQRMMVHGMDTGTSSTAASSSKASSTASSTARSTSSSSSSTSSTIIKSSHSIAAPQASSAGTMQPSSAPQASTSRQPAGVVSAAGRAAAGIEAASATAPQQRSFSSLASSSSSGPGRGFSVVASLPNAKALQAPTSARVNHSCAIAAAALERLEQRRYSNSTTSSSGRGAGTAHMSGIQMARLIVREEGLMGLYRGFVPSISTYVPSSAVWWGLYALYQKLIMAQLHPPPSSGSPGTGEMVAVQTSAAMLSGLTTGFLITPLDLVKTRMQVASLDAQGRQPTWGGTLRTVLSEPAGVRGLFRGAAPRMVSSCVWGTAMLSVYETLVRISVKAISSDSS